MAFVFRSQLDPNIKSTTPGPSHYQPQPRIRLQRPASVPFNQSSPRNIWQPNQLPGPGAYELPLDVSYDRLFMQENGTIMLANRKSQSFNFKSGIQRFKNNENQLPGPGQYDTTQIYAKKQFGRQPREQSTKSSSNSLQKYLLMTHTNKYEKQEGKLQIILDDQSESMNQNKVQKCNQQKKAVPFNSSVQRAMKVRPQTSLGPGSYNICAQEKIADNRRLKPSYSLAKFKKINVAENQEKHELLNQKRISFGKEQRKTEHPKKHTKIVRKKEDFFGSTVGRFYSSQSGRCVPGPGAYEVSACNDKQSKKRKSKLAFGRMSTPQKAQFKTVVSPFVVQVAVENKVQEKAADKKNWHFGSHQPRFKDKSCQQPSQLIEYSSLKICVGGKENKRRNHNKENMKLKLKANKHNVVSCGQKQQAADERPLCYAASANTISHKLGRKCQVNAPFSSQVTRFAEVEKAMNIIEDLLSQNKQNYKQSGGRVKEKVEPRGLMESPNPRFDYKACESNISPCSYNPSKPLRKEFNKLFL